mmetsp:Transcript_10830/g.23992  ORF Transcript_10830/g.23992 Transcript_10830/m.23992 type:complete len:158 (+) Transcript_10830:410-883(+)
MCTWMAWEQLRSWHRGSTTPARARSISGCVCICGCTTYPLPLTPYLLPPPSQMSDYHPDGAQLFFPQSPISFVVCLGLSSHRDDIKPHHMRAFLVPAGMGVMIHPGTWHNGVYVLPQHTPCSFLTRQGKVHARISCSWAGEFKVLLRVPLTLPTREE